ncbi:MAG: alkaline phosphatase family protein [Thermoflavifilum sp.]|uniref:alkaline phosphatase family protein n=1 Tax=Thermoflavifilum sp. TaxID=1968839 RepID=UPI0018A4A9AD|nr:alkaline phosphatase family protein [Thermoflavifilum sp.]QOR76984.1 MAG: alkaline phosphatase family protein [Thermoflavifilum sp.]
MKNISTVFIVAGIFLLMSNTLFAQEHAERLVVVTLDGMRWQEVFTGVDRDLMENHAYTRDADAMKRLYWDASAERRREQLFPFIWNVVAKQGQLLGNRLLGNDMNVSNPYHFSYPGYNEIFTGYPDTSVNSNDKIPNPNTNVLGFIQQQSGFQGRVAAFTSWDVFPYILNKWQSGIYVNADQDSLPETTPEFRLLNRLQYLTAKPLDLRPDIFTYAAAKVYMKAYHPRVVYIAFDETDDYAHAGMYDQYIKSAHAADAMIGDLWKYLQQDTFYAGKTALLITCDHGRGTGDAWRDHGADVQGSSAIWMAVMGPGIPAVGERKEHAQYEQAQIAATLAEILGYHFTAAHPIASSLLPQLQQTDAQHAQSD